MNIIVLGSKPQTTLQDSKYIIHRTAGLRTPPHGAAETSKFFFFHHACDLQAASIALCQNGGCLDFNNRANVRSIHGQAVYNSHSRLRANKRLGSGGILAAAEYPFY